MGKKKGTARRSSSRKPSDTSKAAGYERVPIDKLYFDDRNPRLAGNINTSKPTQKDLLRVLWEKMAVDELAMSIAASGYFEHEPLFVTREDGKLVVIEGNRRLAAVRLLLDAKARSELRATDLPEVSAHLAESLRALPVVRTSPEQAWNHRAFKHVSAPLRWTSYEKAAYIAHLHRRMRIPLEEIARRIGDRHRTARRLYQALAVIEQAEAAGVFNRDNRYTKHFSFSHLYTGLDYDGIAAFLGLSDQWTESEGPVPQSRLDELGELCTWLYGNKERHCPPVVQYQNPDLRQLNDVLRSKEGTAALRAGMPLSVALEVSCGDEEVFRRALRSANEELLRARGRVSSGFRGEDELLRLANSVADAACDLADQMEESISPRGRRNRKKG